MQIATQCQLSFNVMKNILITEEVWSGHTAYLFWHMGEKKRKTILNQLCGKHLEVWLVSNVHAYIRTSCHSVWNICMRVEMAESEESLSNSITDSQFSFTPLSQITLGIAC